MLYKWNLHFLNITKHINKKVLIIGWFSVESRVNLIKCWSLFIWRWNRVSLSLEMSKLNCLHGLWLQVSLVIYTRFKYSPHSWVQLMVRRHCVARALLLCSWDHLWRHVRADVCRRRWEEVRLMTFCRLRGRIQLQALRGSCWGKNN